MITLYACCYFSLALSFFRMQKLAQDQNEKIEAVNRERKYHQVINILVSYHMLYFNTVLHFDQINMLLL